jgi:SAM-dependent methyltransferase
MSLEALYWKVYGLICGEPPYLRPWHYQWLAANDLYPDLRRVLTPLHGRILDVGCGDKPYQTWFAGAEQYIGLDVYPGKKVDYVITPNERWPLDDAAFDIVLCTQVLEHVVDLEHVVSEIRRTLRPGGTLVVSVPFAYHEHLRPHDYRRLSVHGVRELFAADYDILELKPQGRVGNLLGLLYLNWFGVQMYQTRITQAIMGVAMPFWILLSLLVNGLGMLLNQLDTTGSFYHNVLLVARKKADH